MKLAYLTILTCVSIASLPVRAQNPRTAENFMDRGLERQSKGDLDGAIDDFTKVISMKPLALVLAVAYNNRANARLSKNDIDGAIAVAPDRFGEEHTPGYHPTAATQWCNRIFAARHVSDVYHQPEFIGGSSDC